MMGNSNRVEWVDVLKGIAIIWLIVYHFYVFNWMRSPVPVFIFLSGLFFSEGRSFRTFVAKKAKTLLIPFVFFFVLGLIASVFGHLLQGENYLIPPLWQLATLIPVNSEVVNPLGVGAIWFLVSLFEIYIIYYILRLLSKNQWWLLVAGVTLFLLSCITMQDYAMGSLFYLLYTFSFCLYFIVAYQLRGKILYGKIPIIVIIIAMAAYSITYIDTSCLMNESQMRIWGGHFTMFRWLVSTSGLITLLVWLSKKISSAKLITNSILYMFILFEGRNSLTILGVHLLVMTVVIIILNRIMPEGVLYYVILFLLTLLVCNVCVKLFNRYVPFLVNHKKEKNSN